MQLYPLQLEQFLFRELSVTWVPFEVPDADKVQLQCMTSLDYDLACHNHDPSRWKMDLRANFMHSREGKPAGLQIQTAVIGFFVNSSQFPEENRDLLLRISGLQALMGVLRGTIANTTAMFPGDKFVFPSFTAADCVADIEKLRAERLQARATEQERAKAPKVP